MAGEERLVVARSDFKYYKQPGELAVGKEISFVAGAPGIGKVTYELTREDPDGFWGVEKENTIRELDPSEAI